MLTGAAVPLVSVMTVADCQQNAAFGRPHVGSFGLTDVGFGFQVITRLTGFGASAALNVVVWPAVIVTGPRASPKPNS